MTKPNITPDFTVDDIHAIREYNYEMTKDMTPGERESYYKAKANKVRAEMAGRKRELVAK